MKFLLDTHILLWYLLGDLRLTDIESSSQPEATEEELEKHYAYGSLAGQIIMSDDFDEPLEDLKDYT